MRKLTINGFYSDRIIGFTIPRDGVFYICDHDQVWVVQIGQTAEAEVLQAAPYEFISTNRDFLGLVMEGTDANIPLHEVGRTSMSYDFDPENGAAKVRCVAPGGEDEVSFDRFAGDWFAASLSDDGRHLVMAEPYDLAVYALD